jgi:hypothetical protein
VGDRGKDRGGSRKRRGEGNREREREWYRWQEYPVFWLCGQLWARIFVCLHRLIGRGFADYPFARVENAFVRSWNAIFSHCAQAQRITKQKMLHDNKILIRKVRESCNSLAYCSIGKVLMLTERVMISIDVLYLYRADQVVNVLNYWAGCQDSYTSWMISNHNHIWLSYQIISETHVWQWTDILIWPDNFFSNVHNFWGDTYLQSEANRFY